MQHHNDGANALRPITARNDEAPAGDTAQGFQEHEQQDSAARDAERKSVATLQARAALEGFAMRRASGGWIAERWGCSHSFAMLRELSDWLDVVGGVRHDVGPRERTRRAAIDAANREQDQRDEAADLLRGAGGSSHA